MAGLLGGLGGSTLGEVLVKVGVDTKPLQTGLAKSKAEAESAGKSMSAFGTYAKAGFAVAAVAAVSFAKVAVKAASDQVESINKVNVVFGTASRSVEAFASSSATSFGIAKTAALDAAANFGTMFEAAGKTQAQAAKMSTTFVGLSADLASFFNAVPEDVTGKLTSGLAGAVRPLREYGIFISAARVKTEAYASGIAKVGSELTDAQKVQARYNIILQDTTKAQGDFGRTSEGLANSQRILSAQMADLEATLGKILLPAMIAAVHELSDFAKAIDDIANHHIPSFNLNLGLVAKALSLIHNPFADVISQVDKMSQEAPKATAATDGLTGATGQLTNAQRLAAEASQAATKAAHEQLIAMKQLAGGAVGLLASLDQLKSAQVNLNKVRNDSKATTQDLRTAELGVLQAQLGVTGSFKDLVDKQKAAGASSAEIVQKFQELGAKAHLTKSEIQSLTAFIQAYIDKLNAIPNAVNTTVTVNGRGTGTSGTGVTTPGTDGGPGNTGGGGGAGGGGRGRGSGLTVIINTPADPAVVIANRLEHLLRTNR